MSDFEWVAVYKDNSVFPQFHDGKENRYADIRRSELQYFDIWRSVGERKLLVYRIHFDTPDKRLIFRRRVHKRPDGSEMVVVLVGWQITHAKRNIQSLSLIYPAGTIEVFDR